MSKKGESWQYEVQQFRRSDGGTRTQRKLKWDLCPSCGGAKLIGSKVCRDCYEKGEWSWEREAHTVLQRFLESVDTGKPVKRETIEKARALARAKEGE